MTSRITDVNANTAPGVRFGMLTVVCREANDAHGRVRLRCWCQCGHVCVVRRTDLITGNTKSCGCLKALMIRRRMGKVILRRFGSVDALGLAAEGKVKPSSLWVTFCSECGEMVLATTRQLRSGRHHWQCVEATYNTWRNMIQRCTNPKHEQYQDYGGRGIGVCYKWRKSFLAFIRDMGVRPKGKTLDRLDVDSEYSHENCRWSNAKEQAGTGECEKWKRRVEMR